jgi:hypothetical protein
MPLYHFDLKTDSRQIDDIKIAHSGMSKLYIFKFCETF